MIFLHDGVEVSQASSLYFAPHDGIPEEGCQSPLRLRFTFIPKPPLNVLEVVIFEQVDWDMFPFSGYPNPGVVSDAIKFV